MPKITKRGNKYSFRFFEKKGEKPTCFSFSTKKEAENKLIELQYKKEHGTLIPTSTQTVSQLLSKFCEEYGSEKWSASMFSSQTLLIKYYIEPYIGAWKIQDITPDKANSYIHSLKKVPAVETKYHKARTEFVTDATRQKILKLLRTAFNFAVKLDLLERNVFNKIELPKYKEKLRRAATIEEYHRMINYCNNDENRFLLIAIELSVSCSCRLGEVTGLTWENVHLDGSTPFIEIKQSLARESRDAIKSSNITEIYFAFPTEKGSRTQLVLKQPKTDASVRRIYLPSQVAKVLRTWKREQSHNKELLDREYHDYHLVVSQQNGDPVDSTLIDKRMKKMCKALEIDNISFHCFRHTSASLKLKLSGGNYKAVQADSGHATTQMLLDRYGHAFDEDRIENARKVGEALFSENTADTLNIDSQVASIIGNEQLLTKLLEVLQHKSEENQSCTKPQNSFTAE